MTLSLSRIASFASLALPRLAYAAGDALGTADEINVGGSGTTDLKAFIINAVRVFLTYVAILAVVVIIIAGIWMILGLGEESSKEKAKKIVIYTIVGLILIMIARAIVMFIIGLG